MMYIFLVILCVIELYGLSVNSLQYFDQKNNEIIPISNEKIILCVHN